MYVYFIQAVTGGPIKIGRGERPDFRLDAVQIGNHEELRILGVALGNTHAETSLHKKYAKQKIRGEWYRPTPDLLALIAKLPDWTSVQAGKFCPEIAVPFYSALRDLYLRGFSLQDCAVASGYTAQRVHQILRGPRRNGRPYATDFNPYVNDITKAERPERPLGDAREIYAEVLARHAAVEVIIGE